MKILYFAPIYFSDMKQRPQQIAEKLSKQHKVYYIEPTISVVRRIIKGGDKSCKGERVKINNNLEVIRLNGMFTFHKSIEILDVFGINNFSEVLQLEKLIRLCDVVWVGYSGWYTVVRHIKNKPIIFDKMDEEDMLATSNILKRTLFRNKTKMVEISNALIVTCNKFYKELKSCGKPIYLIPNAVSDNFVVSENARKNTKKIRTIGYVGTISEWFDMDIVNELLRMDDELEIMLVGRNYLPENKNPRVKYFGVRPNEELPDIIQKFDICLYNFKPSKLLDTINPVKIYEYLSMNKPVLAVKSQETIPLKDYLMIYENIDDIRSYLSGTISPPFHNESERKKFVDENSWTARTDKINNILKELERV